METSPFSAPFSSGHPRSEGFCSQGKRLLSGRGPATCDLNHRLAISEASVGRNVALRESAGSDAGLLLRLNEDFQVRANITWHFARTSKWDSLKLLFQWRPCVDPFPRRT